MWRGRRWLKPEINDGKTCHPSRPARRLGVRPGSTLAAVACVGLALVSPSCSSPVEGEPLSRSSPVTITPSPGPSASPSPSFLDSTTEEATEAPAGAIHVEMHGPPPRFVPDAYTAAAGAVRFFLNNTSPRGHPHGHHSLAIGRTLRTPLVVSEYVAGGDSAVFTVRNLEAGHYVIWCTFTEHLRLGQVGTLTVS